MLGIPLKFWLSEETLLSTMKVVIGQLVPLQKSLAVDNSVKGIPIYQGLNVMGRENLTSLDKRVSHKHISLHASVGGFLEVVVEGPNPIVIRSGSERKRLGNQEKGSMIQGDILELIPGNHLFKYEEVQDKHASTSEAKSSLSSGGKRPSVDNIMITKRSRQSVSNGGVSENSEVKEKTCNKVQNVLPVHAKSSGSQVEPTSSSSRDAVEFACNFWVPKDDLPLLFRLMRVQGLPAWANSSCVGIEDVIQGDILIAILSNYMVDIDWLLSACPKLTKVPHVLILHGESSARLENHKPKNWVLHKPPLPISYGTHHSKAMILVYPKGVRVVVHTANLIYVDWNNKSQGLWMQDFPWKDQKDLNKGSPFENDLVSYLNVLKWPEFNANLPNIGNVHVNASFSKDSTTAVQQLVASVPGYHTGLNLKKWGHMKLQSILEECIFDKEFYQAPLVYQFSSLGSLDEKWLSEFAVSTSSGKSSDKLPLGIGKPLIIWPTVEDVRCSLEGYAAGNAIPSPLKNVEKDFLRKFWARWKANHVGRCRAMPHIKTYTRYNGQSLAWFLLTSANLSKAAWGALQKNNSQLMIRSYELGVLFLPLDAENYRSPFSCTDDGVELESTETIREGKTKLVTLCWNGNRNNSSQSEFISLPLPYQLPPQPYTTEDTPWSWDHRYTKKDVYGKVWPRQVQLYMDQDS